MSELVKLDMIVDHQCFRGGSLSSSRPRLKFLADLSRESEQKIMSFRHKNCKRCGKRISCSFLPELDRLVIYFYSLTEKVTQYKNVVQSATGHSTKNSEE